MAAAAIARAARLGLRRRGMADGDVIVVTPGEVIVTDAAPFLRGHGTYVTEQGELRRAALAGQGGRLRQGPTVVRAGISSALPGCLAGCVAGQQGQGRDWNWLETQPGTMAVCTHRPPSPPLGQKEASTPFNLHSLPRD